MANGLFSEYVKGYRADPKGKFGGKDRLETLPIKFQKSEMYSILKGLKDAEKLGMPKLSDQQLANMFLNEGRSDAGYNQYDVNNPRAQKLYEQMREKGYDSLSSGFAAAVLDRSDVAKKNKVSFDEAWNGLGVTSEGRTGRQNAERLAAGSYAPTVAKNSDLMSFITKARSGTLPQEEVVVADLPNKLRNQQVFGGLGGSGMKRYIVESLMATDPVTAKQVEQMPSAAIYDMVVNRYYEINKIKPPTLPLGFANQDGMVDDFGRSTKQSKFDDWTARQLVMSKPSADALLNTIAGAALNQPLPPAPVASKVETPWYKDPFGFTIK